MSELAANLRRLRGEQSQRDFAAKLGIRQQTYANYEIGSREPDLDTLCRIAKVLGRSSDALLGLEAMREDKNAQKILDLKKAIIALLKEY